MAAGPALTARAVAVGLALAALVAVVAPYSDWRLRNTYLYGQHLPMGVLLLVVVAGLVVNPLLGRRRFRSGELLVMSGLLLVLGGVVSSGLNRTFTGVVAGPARLLTTSSELDPLVGDGGVQLPQGYYLGIPAHGAPDRDSAEQRYLVDGFHDGLRRSPAVVTHRAQVTWRGPDGQVRTAMAWEGPRMPRGALDLTSEPGSILAGHRAGERLRTVGGVAELVAVEAPALPWGVWAILLARWSPLLLGAVVAFLAIAALTRDQWIHRERLPYPIASAMAELLARPPPGGRVAAVYADRGFQVGATVVATVLLVNGTGVLGLHPFRIPLGLDLSGMLAMAPWDHAWALWGLASPRLFFSIAALTFFLPVDVSFSLWFWFVLGNLAYGLLAVQGVPVRWTHPSQVVAGGWMVECLLILWMGRRHLLRIARAAVTRAADADAATVRALAWTLLGGVAAMIAAMVGAGAQVGHACLAALVFLGMGLVLARLVAEAGIPFVQGPIGWQATAVIFSFTGVTAPAAALVPLTLLAQTLCADPREHLLPFAVNAEFLADRARAPRLRWGALCLLVVAVGACISGAVMLLCAYRGDGMGALDGYWRSALMDQGLGPVAHAAGGGAAPRGGIFLRYGLGAVIVGGLGMARLAWGWWPLHPVGFLVSASYPTIVVWFSFFVGWLAKILVMRYGGLGLYRRLKPVALGMIAGEALVVGGFLLLSLAAAACGLHLHGQPHFLPG